MCAGRGSNVLVSTGLCMAQTSPHCGDQIGKHIAFAHVVIARYQHVASCSKMLGRFDWPIRHPKADYHGAMQYFR